MEPRIEQIESKKLIGLSMNMSLANNKTGALWADFMKQRKKITNAIGTNLYSLQVYEPLHFQNFDMNKEFQKWALMEVKADDTAHHGMKSFLLPAGLYAIFFYKGKPADGGKLFNYIFTQWLPNSVYILDDRPHFEVLGANYKNNDADSEEEIYIPIKPKGN